MLSSLYHNELFLHITQIFTNFAPSFADCALVLSVV